MTTSVRLLFADPRVEVLEGDDDVWVVSGVDPERPGSVVRDAATVEAVRSSLTDVAETAVIDHLLFRAPVAPTTYLQEIRAVEHGTSVHWDLARDERTVARVEAFSADAETDGDRPVALGETLADVLDQGTAGSADVANMLSGGNDRGSM